MFHNMLKTTLPIVMIALTLLAAPAGASPNFFPTRTDWTAAVTNIITAPFDAQAGPTAYTGFNTLAGLTVGEVTFVGFTGTPGEYNLKVYNPAYSAPLERGSGPSLGGGWSPGYLLATLPAGGVYALAVDFTVEQTALGRSVTITLSNEESYTITAPTNSSMAFWGFTSLCPITDIKFSATDAFTMIDNFSYASFPGAEETPEPIGLVLGATGVAAIWLARRMRRFC